MNTDLEPPAVPPLSPDQRDRLRRQLMQRTSPAVRRTPAWAAPLVAVGAVTAIVAGTIAVVDHPRAEPGPAASPSPKTMTDQKRPASPIPDQSAIILPFPDAVDLGPPSAADAAAAAKACHVPGGGTRLEVLWSRRLKGAAPGSSFVQLLVRSTGPGRQVVAVCQQGIGAYRVEDRDWIRAATSKKGVTAFVGASWSTQPTKMYFQQWTMYWARKDIARIESRYVWPGGSSAWIKGVVAGGFAYTDSRAVPVTQKPVTPTEQLRAFDAQGRPVPVQ